MRIKRQKREAAAYIMLKRKGVSINQISKAFGRSTSFIFRLLKNSKIHFGDLRKLPSYVKALGAARISRTMEKLIASWEQFILGEVEKPP